METEEKKFIAEERQYLMHTYKRYPIEFVGGEDCLLFDSEGKEYIDFLSGIGVCSVGYRNPRVIDAVCSQAQKLIHVSNWFYTAPQIELARNLVELSFADKCFFANSGAEANEGAIKLVRKYSTDKYGANRYEVVTAIGSFHGRTLATVAATGQPVKQRDFEPMPLKFRHVPFNNLEAMKAAVDEKTAAVMIEPVQGEGGVFVASREFLKGLRSLCDKTGTLLIFDEIQCGLGRLGALFAYELFGIVPDVVTLAKALGGGLPIGAILTSDDIAAAFRPGDHGTTFGGNPVACSAAIEVLAILSEPGFLDSVGKTGRYFFEMLKEIKDSFEIAREIRGLGLMLALDFHDEISEKMVRCLLDRGFVVNNVSKTAIRFLPPLTIQEEQIEKLGSNIKEVLSGGEYEKY